MSPFQDLPCHRYRIPPATQPCSCWELERLTRISRACSTRATTLMDGSTVAFVAKLTFLLVESVSLVSYLENFVSATSRHGIDIHSQSSSAEAALGHAHCCTSHGIPQAINRHEGSSSRTTARGGLACAILFTGLKIPGCTARLGLLKMSATLSWSRRNSGNLPLVVGVV